MAALRRAGARWRILVHERAPNERLSGVSHSIASVAKMAGKAGEWHEVRVLPGTEFDELVIGEWIHLEQLDVGRWYMNVGGVHIEVRAGRDGRAEWVDVYGPGDYDESVPGCKYECSWSREDDERENWLLGFSGPSSSARGRSPG